MEYSISPAGKKDLSEIFALFDAAIQFQKMNHFTGWNSYDEHYIKKDVQRGLLYKMANRENLICIFSICYTDELIWRELEKGDALYLHRIILNRKYQGIKVFGTVLEWAVRHARERRLKFIRMDTWAENEKLIRYYKKYGFRFIENYTTADTQKLPVQHRNLNVALLEHGIG